MELATHAISWVNGRREPATMGSIGSRSGSALTLEPKSVIISTMRPFERVLTMTDYYDGPRRGIANFNGAPHFYESQFLDQDDEFDDVFELRPIDGETLSLALEDWSIWLRWEVAFYAKATSIDTHPALPADRARHEEIIRVLAPRIASLPGPRVRARGVFRPADAAEAPGLEVQWVPVVSASG